MIVDEKGNLHITKLTKDAILFGNKYIATIINEISGMEKSPSDFANISFSLSTSSIGQTILSKTAKLRYVTGYGDVEDNSENVTANYEIPESGYLKIVCIYSDKDSPYYIFYQKDGILLQNRV